MLNVVFVVSSSELAKMRTKERAVSCALCYCLIAPPPSSKYVATSNFLSLCSPFHTFLTLNQPAHTAHPPRRRADRHGSIHPSPTRLVQSPTHAGTHPAAQGTIRRSDSGFPFRARAGRVREARTATCARCVANLSVLKLLLSGARRRIIIRSLVSREIVTRRTSKKRTGVNRSNIIQTRYGRPLPTARFSVWVVGRMDGCDFIVTLGRR